MNIKNSLVTAIILTKNEEKHILRCIDSLSNIAGRIIVVDSGSTDQTCVIAKNNDAEVYFNKWINHANQINWAISNIEINSNWILRIDADEVILPDLENNLLDFLINQKSSVAGVTINRRIYFMDKWIRHGGIYPIKQLRIWRNGKGHCENRLMDEHIVVDGDIEHLDYDFADINLNNITWWTQKHNNYAILECVESIITNQKKAVSNRSRLSSNAKIKRYIKENVYLKLPLGIRPLLYFLYRYIFLLGFMDGKTGFLFHFLQGFWYRLLVDIKIHETYKISKEHNIAIEKVIEEEFGIYDIYQSRE